eukprot:CAMPEP_0172542658 /NCGR_PEP_ID=MMETSP1067-20121228/13230_1 /TAXON_ID=265564 ORGANISM="Thalassiosira punctigera, Strain Tpunct2005C2" /NCGR_SAMPLE_ID=MMETSP1067 /ASSEMBLY_ACC=CAM_ASM_000444 /LENGTH=55 /DNA_ID=CAMNT_0013328945 /DNA_START=122 /DNA_END=285 /DNA_ORIENTATION=+
MSRVRHRSSFGEKLAWKAHAGQSDADSLLGALPGRAATAIAAGESAHDAVPPPRL